MQHNNPPTLVEVASSPAVSPINAGHSKKTGITSQPPTWIIVETLEREERIIAEYVPLLWMDQPISWGASYGDLFSS
jgi:hypothetical protein